MPSPPYLQAKANSHKQLSDTKKTAALAAAVVVWGPTLQTASSTLSRVACSREESSAASMKLSYLSLTACMYACMHACRALCV